MSDAGSKIVCRSRLTILIFFEAPASKLFKELTPMQIARFLGATDRKQIMEFA
jgi:hypothetical protein